VNIIPIGTGFEPYSFYATCLLIPKKLRLRKESRFLTFREILGSEIGRFVFSEQYEGAGIDVVENTPEEILAVTIEMEERLQQKWQARTEDDDLQERFLSILNDCGLKDSGPPRIGADFLRQNRHLLQ
jgi:putative glycosyltransferase (TIGR04372 family)